METKETPTLYYIYGVANRGEEVIKLLEEYGGVNTHHIDGGNEECVYYIDYDSTISYVQIGTSRRFNMVTTFGKELRLKMLDWSDVCRKGELYGYALAKGMKGWWLVKDGKDKDGNRYSINELFASAEQVESVMAAAMIAQIRRHGEKSYGKIAPAGELAYTIITNGDGLDVALQVSGGLLRFEDAPSAAKFIEYNEKLVNTYLRTF